MEADPCVAWLASFPKVRLNLVYQSTGEWLCWCVLRGYGTVLWRQFAHPGNQIVATAYDAARLPRTSEGLIPKGTGLYYSTVHLGELRAQLRREQEREMARKPVQHTMQHTLDLSAAHSK